MKTYLADIIPRIQKYSKRLDDFILLTKQNWVSIGDTDDKKIVYIFDKDGEVDIFENGVGVDNGTWKFKNSDSIKLSLKNSPALLLRLGFIEDNIMALKLDGTESYVFFVNESKYQKELNNIELLIEFLNHNYIVNTSNEINNKSAKEKVVINEFETDKGTITVEVNFEGAMPALNNRVFQNKNFAPSGKYKIGLLNYIVVKEGEIIDLTMF